MQCIRHLQQRSNFQVMTSGRPDIASTIEFLGSFYSVANNAGKVDRNYELLEFKSFFGLWQLRQPVLPRLPIFWFSRKIFIVSYGMLIH